MKKSLLILPLVLLASALALAACGGGGSSSSGSGEEAAIEETIEKSATTSDPSKCTELQTQAFNEQEKGVSGEEATEVCEEAAEEKETVAEGVSVSNVSVEGEKATADAEVEGSGLNGQTVELELVEEEGQWKLNQFLGFASYDSEALAAALEEELEGEEGVSSSEIKCLGEGFSEMSQEEAESVAFEANIEVVEELLESCK
ncbi:MAG TPA: hypothetical protein VMH33_08645 [Solirubrobacterales bacterium]|nr:hypothetical protein [Solirubrobacterales bacterium]